MIEAAKLGCGVAKYRLGKMFLCGDEVAKNVDYALRWLEESVSERNQYAEYLLGKIYLYGREVERDYDKAIAYLTASAEHGNQYAAQLLHSIRSNRNRSAAMSSLRLLGQIGRAIQHRLEDERKGKTGVIDRKLKRIIDEKKQAHGLKQG